MSPFETKQLKLTEKYDHIAPDGSEIRTLPEMKRGGMAHGTLPPDGVSKAIRHKTIEEIWYFIEGQGEVWRKQGDREEVVKVFPGICLTIPTGTHFQFRNTGKEPHCFIMATMPLWPGDGEVVEVEGRWDVEDLAGKMH